jgi:hypothetical protein
MYETFGARLRRRREEQAIALVTIANQTKIKSSLFEELERDNVSHWPSGLFRRAYIRAYAAAIGLDPEAVVREFLAVHPDPAEIIEPPVANGVSAEKLAGSGPPTRLRSIVSSAFTSFSRSRRASASETLSQRAQTPPANPPVPDSEASIAAASSDPDLAAVAHVCTEFGRVATVTEVQSLLQKAARLLHAIGVIVWVWDKDTEELKPAIVHGYPEKVVAHLPAVRRDADNATAVAFRSAQTCEINGNDHTSGALVVPLLTAAGCAGVLALELQHGIEQTALVRVAATIFAALLARFIGDPALNNRNLGRSVAS